MNEFRNVIELAKEVHRILGTYVPIPPPKHFSPNAGTWEKQWHKGSLYSHCLWVSRAASLAFQKSGEDLCLNPWTRGLSLEQDLCLLIHASLLHDIGKAGDNHFQYISKPLHELRGSQVLMNKAKFVDGSNGKEYDCSKLLEIGGWSNDEKMLIVFLVASHSMFGFTGGYLLENRIPNDSKEAIECFQELFEQMLRQAKEIGINFNVFPFRKIARLACLIGACDIRGLLPVFTVGSHNNNVLNSSQIPQTFEVQVEKIGSLWDHQDYGHTMLSYRNSFIEFVDSQSK